MESLYEENLINNIKSEQVCRTCLIDEGHFFNISDTFDHYTLTQMIQNITNLQIHPTDGYTQFICEQCIQKLREAHTFRIQCLESYNTLTTLDPISVCEVEFPIIEEVKKTIEETCDSIDDNFNVEDNLDTENDLDAENDFQLDISNIESHYDKVEDPCTVTKKVKKNPKSIIFDCPLCHGIFSSTYVYEKHVKKLHPDRINDECFKKEPQPLGYISKNKNSKKYKFQYKCSLDEFKGNSLDEFKNHLIEHTGDKSVLCTDCGFRTKNLALLKTHRAQKHLGEWKYSCTLCNYSCKANKSLIKHMSSHSNEKNYKCDLCPKSYKYATGLTAHKMSIHKNKKPHACQICGKTFYSKQKLKAHSITHTKERPHVCHHCGKGFSSAENMRTHVKLQHEPIISLHTCHICGYSTKQKYTLKTHIQNHYGVKKFFCPQCPFSTLLQNRLKTHMIRHSGLRNFSCDLCDYKAVSADDVKKHKIKHTGEKPFQCSICEYRGSTKNALSRHLETHGTEQKFQCPNCPYKNNVKGNLANHMRRSCHFIKKQPSIKTS